MRKVGLLVSVLATTAAFGVGCGGDDDDAANGGAEQGDRASLSVGAAPIAPVAPLVLGVQEGFFEEENLDVRVESGAQAGAAALTQVVGGELEIGFSDVVSQIIALERGLPIRGIAHGNAGGAEPDNTYFTVGVRGESDIRDPNDLEGKTIGTNVLNNISDVTIKAALEAEGADISTVEFVEIPIPQLPAALDEGRIDAAVLLEPFLSQAQAQGARMVLYPYSEVIPTGTIASYFTTDEFAEQNPDVVERFQRAMQRSTEYAAANPDEVRAVIPEYTQIPAEASEQMILPIFAEDQLGTEAVERLSDLLERYEIIEQQPDLEKLLPPAP